MTMTKTNKLKRLKRQQQRFFQACANGYLYPRFIPSIRNGCDWRAKNEHGQSGLDIAIANTREVIGSILVALGIEYSDENKENALVHPKQLIVKTMKRIELGHSFETAVILGGNQHRLDPFAILQAVREGEQNRDYLLREPRKEITMPKRNEPTFDELLDIENEQELEDLSFTDDDPNDSYLWYN